MTQENIPDVNLRRFGFYTALFTSVLTLITFAVAYLTPPLSGPLCISGCYEYPYLDIASRFPRDYWWMYPAMLVTVMYVVLIACIHVFALAEKKIFSLIGLSFALIAAAALLIDYFIQVSVIQPSLLKGEHDGISILSQYNPHGIFIALEELGYLLMSVSFLFLVPVFARTSRAGNFLRWICMANFLLAVFTFVFFSLQYGIYREYRFEIAIISINWFTLIAVGILLSVVFRRPQNVI